MDRRELIKLGAGALGAGARTSGFAASVAGVAPATAGPVEQWTVFEFTANGPSRGIHSLA